MEDEGGTGRPPMTRRERNDDVDIPSPPLIVSDLAVYLWNWYFEISDSIRRVRSGVCEPIPPSEFSAWRENTGEIVHPSEYAILRAMDRSYCAEMNKELVAYRERENDRRRQEIEAARSKR